MFDHRNVLCGSVFWTWGCCKLQCGPTAIKQTIFSHYLVLLKKTCTSELWLLMSDCNRRWKINVFAPQNWTVNTVGMMETCCVLQLSTITVVADFKCAELHRKHTKSVRINNGFWELSNETLLSHIEIAADVNCSVGLRQPILQKTSFWMFQSCTSLFVLQRRSQNAIITNVCDEVVGEFGADTYKLDGGHHLTDAKHWTPKTWILNPETLTVTPALKKYHSWCQPCNMFAPTKSKKMFSDVRNVLCPGVFWS